MLHFLTHFLTPFHNLDAQSGDTVFEVFVDEAKAQKIIQRAMIFGNPVEGRVLTTARLAEAGLMPAYGIILKNSFGLFFSQPYYEPQGRLAVVGYVQHGASFIVSSYYLSNSQGMWRYLVNYTFDEEGFITNYGKGHGEESVTLSHIFQKILACISSSPKLIQTAEAQLIFFGVAKRRGRGIAPIYEKVHITPQLLEGTMYHSHPLAKVDPHYVQFTAKTQAPDFSHSIASWKQNSPLYGDIAINVFLSYDRALTYMVCKDVMKRIWIGSIENTSNLLPIGLRARWVKGGVLTTPAYEYLMPEVQGQPPQYWNKQLIRGPYVDMYEKYISQIPLIQEYITYDRN